MKRTWNKFSNETDTAYHRFSIYLSFGPDRSLEKVRRKVGKRPGYSRVLQKWSSRYDWVQRARAYDEHMYAKVLDGKEKTIIAAKERILEKVHIALDELFSIMEGTNSQREESGKSNTTSEKLKAIELTLKLAGVTLPKFNKTEEDSVTNFIQKVSNHIIETNQCKTKS